MNSPKPNRRVFIGAFIRFATLLHDFESIKNNFSDCMSAKWTRTAENFHITFHFFGEMPMNRILELDKILKNHFPKNIPVALDINGIDYFSRKGKPRILYLKFQNPDKKLFQIHRELQEILSRNEFIAQKTEGFVPHITLARIKKTNRNFFEQIAQYDGKKIAHIDEVKIEIIESVLGPEGALYLPIKSPESD